MPLPISHSLAGASIFWALDRDGTARHRGRLLAAVVAANAPDFDLLPGLLIGDPNRFHHGPSHSLFTGVVLAFSLAWLLGPRRCWPLRPGWPRGVAATALMLALCWGSHILLDSLTYDPSPPVGVPMLWPLTPDRVSIAPLFARADKMPGPGSAGAFVSSLLSAHNARAAGVELLALGPLAALLWWRRARPRTG